MSVTTSRPDPVRKADTFLVSCIDPRLTDDTTFRLAALGRTDRYSEMRIAGAALGFVNDRQPQAQATLWETLDATRKMHGIRAVTLLNHRDCGALREWTGRDLAQDPVEELRIHTEVLNAAADAIRARHPDLLVEIKLMDLQGQVVRPACRSCIPTGFTLGPNGPDGLPALIPIAQPNSPQRPEPGRLTDMARLRNRAGPLDRDSELALLGTGISEGGLSAAEARQELNVALGDRPSATAMERDVAVWLQTQADRRGRISKTAVEQASQLYRRLHGPGMTMDQATRHTVRLAHQEGLEPQPTGFWPFRSVRWFNAHLTETAKPKPAA